MKETLLWFWPWYPIGTLIAAFTIGAVQDKLDWADVVAILLWPWTFAVALGAFIRGMSQ